MSAPMQTALTGLELLLARAQLWQDTAARHVSLARQLERLSRLALRWRRLQLAAWRGTVRAAAERHAEGACLGCVAFEQQGCYSRLLLFADACFSHMLPLHGHAAPAKHCSFNLGAKGWLVTRQQHACMLPVQ